MLLFFDLSSGEILLIVFVAFIVLGPKKIPEVARTIGKAMNEVKRASSGFKDEINKEVQRIDRETRLKEYITDKDLQKINQALKPLEDTKEFISETNKNIKKPETNESVQ